MDEARKVAKFTCYNPRPLYTLQAESDEATIGLHNDKLIKHLLEDWSQAFDRVFAKRAFLHWYERTIMEVQDMLEARE